MKIGYIRVSTAEQNENRQVIMMAEQQTERNFIDKQSGKNADRPALKEMLSFVREGDTVVVESISRLARSTRDLLTIVDTLTQKNVNFISLKESIDTTTPTGRFTLTIFAALAELERETTLQRQSEGIAIAKAEGKYKGRQPIKIDEEQFRKVCKRWRNGEITATKAMDLLSVKPNTFYRRVKEMGI